MSQSSVAPVTILRINDQESTQQPDLLAAEEPLEIRLGFGPASKREQRSLAVTMRTPGNDEELCIGFLFTEGIIQSLDDFTHLAYCTDVDKPEEQGNVIRIELKPNVKLDWKKLERHFYTGSSCGVCGKSSIEAVHAQTCSALPQNHPVVAAELIHQLPDRLREAQKVFEHTGGLHATALFSPSGELLLLREDIGRHNALDKAIGAAMQSPELHLNDCIALVSGRVGFELVQKSVVAGIPILAAVGAPSSLAVDLAKSSELTLIGFVRQQRFNLYTGVERLQKSTPKT